MGSFAVIGKRKYPYGLWFSLPSSKSISNRLLIIQQLAGSSLEIRNLSTSDDTILLSRHLDTIRERTASINAESEYVELECKNAGTTCRFLIALFSITCGKWRLRADERMENRPLKPLIEVLQSLGADIKTADENRIFPLEISGKPLQGGKRVKLPSNLSSQFISALALIAPYMKEGLEIELSNAQVSMPYVEMTVALMKRNNAELKLEKNVLKIFSKPYSFCFSEVEADWSAAAFAYSLVATNQLNELKIKGLRKTSLQGDSIVESFFAEFFDVSTKYQEDYGILSYREALSSANKHVKIDFRDCPDLFLPLLVTTVLQRKSFVFTSLETLTYKESDRLHNALRELAKFGVKPQLLNNTLSMQSNDYPDFSALRAIEIDTYADHRMAMAFAMFACQVSGLLIKDPDCVVKSFPNFWTQFSNLFSIYNLHTADD